MKVSISTPLPPGHRRAVWGSSGPQNMLLLLLVGLAVAGAVPTSVLSSAKEANAHFHATGSDASQQSQQPQQSRSSATSNPVEVKNQISVPQKRGVNPLLYNDFDYSGNSIPHGGMWDDLNAVPSSSAFARAPLAAALFPDQLPDSRVRNYDLLASLLGPPPPPALQTFYGDPVTPSVSYPYVFGQHGYGDRSKRMTSGSPSERNPLRSLRLKRSPSKLTAADALSLLALLESRDPYPSMSDYFPLVPANGPNDVLPYPPNSVYQDIPLSLALAQLGGGGGASRNTARLAPYSDDDGEWMNTWTEPAVDYLGFPVDVDTLSRLENLDTKPTKNGISHQKRFMITKKKRSVSLDDNDDCKNGGSKKTCLLRKYGQLAGTKVAPA